MNKENCELKLVDEIIIYYDARSKKHQITELFLRCTNVFKILRLSLAMSAFQCPRFSYVSKSEFYSYYK